MLYHMLWKKATRNGSQQGGKTASAPNSQGVSQQPRDPGPSRYTEDALLREILGHFPLMLNSLLSYNQTRQKTPRTQSLLNGLSSTRRLPVQSHSNGTTWPAPERWVSAARNSPRLHTWSLTFLKDILHFLPFSWAFGKLHAFRRCHPTEQEPALCFLKGTTAV